MSIFSATVAGSVHSKGKMLLSEFIRRYPDFSFEIVDEHDGYQGLIYGGYLSLPERENVVDMTLSITYTGAIFYERAE